VSLQQVSDSQSWLSTSQQASQGMVNAASTAKQNQPVGGTSGGVVASGLASGNSALAAAASMAISSSFMLAPSAPVLSSFNSQVWTAVQPLVQAMTWMNAGTPLSSAYLSVPSLRQVLNIASPPMAPASTGDPFVDWVDSMLYNGGQPLAVGSLPLYGTTGQNNAFQALDQAIGMSLDMVSRSLAFTGFGAGFQMGVAAANGDALGVAVGAAGIVAMLNPCAMVAKGTFAAGERGAAVALEMTSSVSTLSRVANVFTGVVSAVEFAQTGDPMALLGVAGSALGFFGFFGACFAAGTPIRTPEGTVAVESIQAGDLVLSRSEFDPSGPIEAKVVEELFVTVSPVLDLRVGGQTITTTGGHPFYAEGRGWTAAKDLEPGQRVLGMQRESLLVEWVEDSGLVATVYNFRVADYHTYFVGDEEWGWSVWAHNAYTNPKTGKPQPNKTTLLSVDRAVQRASHNTFGTFHKSGADGTWWSKDMTGHGGSAWKVFEENKKGLQWIADADQYGNFIKGKHKSATGQFIPWKHLKRQ